MDNILTSSAKVDRVETHATPRKRYGTALAAVLSLFVLGACGSSTSDRALSGGAIGAAAGGVTGLVVGAPVTGALVGGAVGAATGAITDESDIDLGDPIWR